jgi:hypothetical protein
MSRSKMTLYIFYETNLLLGCFLSARVPEGELGFPATRNYERNSPTKFKEVQQLIQVMTDDVSESWIISNTACYARWVLVERDTKYHYVPTVTSYVPYVCADR